MNFFAWVFWRFYFCFFSVLGIRRCRFLPAFRQAEQVFAFLSMSARLFGHQNMAAFAHILLIPGCPKWRAFCAAYLKVFGTIILSSTMVIPRRWMSLFIIGLYASRGWLRLSSSIQHCSSIRSGYAAVSLIKVSRSSIKSNSAALTFSSCFLLLTALFPITRLMRA